MKMAKGARALTSGGVGLYCGIRLRDEDAADTLGFVDTPVCQALAEPVEDTERLHVRVGPWRW